MRKCEIESVHKRRIYCDFHSDRKTKMSSHYFSPRRRILEEIRIVERTNSELYEFSSDRQFICWSEARMHFKIGIGVSWCSRGRVVTVTWESSRCPGSQVKGRSMPTSRGGGFKTGSRFWFWTCRIPTTSDTYTRSEPDRFQRMLLQ